MLAEFHAFQANANQPCWSCTQGAAVPATLPARGELWNNSVDFYQGQTINRLDVAALGQNAPVPPGITRLPRAGDYYASPALATLIKTVPADQLGERFPGTMIGTIGQAGLSGPGDLAIYTGHTPARVGNISGTQWVTSISSAPGQEVFSPFFRYAFGIGVLAVVFPMLVLISTATRLAANRREERFAALRLVGGTPGDVRIVATVEAVLSGFVGAVLGTVIFLLVRPALAGAALVGTQYFESELTPTVAGYVAMLIGVPIAAAIAALLSLRRVQISPLGVTRRATPKPPTFWRLIALVIGVGVFVYGLSKTTRDGIGAPAYPGLILTMIGLVIAGPWLTAQAARLFGRSARGSSALLAARRLADNPKGAFRAVSGLTLAVFLGTMVGLIVPALNATEATPTAGALSNILLGQIGLPTAAGQQLISGISAIPGALERVRTYLAVHAPPQVGGDKENSPTPPRTFGETLQIRLDRANTFERIMYAAIALTLIVAGCSLAVAVGGGLVDRKRPFTLLRVSGTQVSVLSRVVLFEAAVPLAAATVLAAGIAYGTSLMAFLRLAPVGTAIPQLGRDYYTIMGIGLVIAFGVITVTLPLLRRMTAPSTIRFE